MLHKKYPFNNQLVFLSSLPLKVNYYNIVIKKDLYRLFKSFRSVTICSAVLSVFCALTGLLVSILAGTPTGSTIVAADIIAFLACCIISALKRRTAQ